MTIIRGEGEGLDWGIIFVPFLVEKHLFYYLEDFTGYCRVFDPKEGIVVEGAHLASSYDELEDEILEWLNDPTRCVRSFSKLRVSTSAPFYFFDD